MMFLKKFWLPLMVLLLMLYVVAFIMKSNNESKKLEQVEAQRLLQIESVEYEAITKANANYQWIGRLLSDMPRKLFASYLEKEWLIGRPIFFPGYVKDIATDDAEHYLMTIKYQKIYYLIPSTTLKLVCEKSLVDSFLSENPDVRSGDIDKSGVGALANIKSISMDDDGRLVGHGVCLQLLRDGGPLEQYKMIKFD